MVSLAIRASIKSIPVTWIRSAHLRYCARRKFSLSRPVDEHAKRPIEPPVGSSFVTKRSPSGRYQSRDTQGAWSIVAYNLSEELRIDGVQTLKDRFEDYKMVDLPDDIHDEAVMLSANIEGADGSPKPLNDIFLFREGAIVFWGVDYERQKKVLSDLSPLQINPYSTELIQEEREHLDYSIKSTIEKSKMARGVAELKANKDQAKLHLDQFSLSHAVALSVKLAIWETMLDRYIESVDWVTDDMKNGKALRLTREKVFRMTGELYELKHRINLSSDLLDLPDVYWDRPEHENLFLSLTSFLNLRRRTTVMNDKLNNCCELMNLLSNHMNDKQHIRLEWMIIVLILIEVMFELIRFL